MDWSGAIRNLHHRTEVTWTPSFITSPCSSPAKFIDSPELARHLRHALLARMHGFGTDELVARVAERTPR